MEEKEFYEKFKKDKGLNFCEGLDDVFELMREFSNYKLSKANEKLKEMELSKKDFLLKYNKWMFLNFEQYQPIPLFVLEEFLSSCNK